MSIYISNSALGKLPLESKSIDANLVGGYLVRSRLLSSAYYLTLLAEQPGMVASLYLNNDESTYKSVLRIRAALTVIAHYESGFTISDEIVDSLSGDFDGDLSNAVFAFQQFVGIENPDGKVDGRTVIAMDKLVVVLEKKIEITESIDRAHDLRILMTLDSALKL